jgi:hypothetical protein
VDTKALEKLHPEDGGDKFLRNVVVHLQDHTTERKTTISSRIQYMFSVSFLAIVSSYSSLSYVFLLSYFP